MAFFVRSSIFLGRTTNHYRKCGLCFLINNYLFKSSSLYLLINNFNKFNLVIFRLIFKLKSFIVNVFSVHNFSLLDILHYLYSCRYILSAFIFIFYFINVINGLNIDIKEIYKIIDFLTKNGGFKNYILNINMNFDDNININFKHNNS